MTYRIPAVMLLTCCACCLAQTGVGTLVGGVVHMQAETAFEVWVTDSLDNVLRSDAPPDDAVKTVRLEAARNEYESGQIVVRSGQAIAGLKASIAGLNSPGGSEIPAADCRCRFVAYVSTGQNSPATPPEELVAQAPVHLPDPLLEEPAIDVEPDVCQPVWLTVYVPPDTPAGDYQGAVSLTWDGGEATVPVTLTVWPFAVPEDRHLYFTNWFAGDTLAKRYGVGYLSEQFWPIFERYVANCAAHRQNILWVSPWSIKPSVDAQGKWSFDFTNFDRWVEILEKHGVADLIEISPLGHHKSGWGGTQIALGDVRVFDSAGGESKVMKAEQVLPHYLPALQEHLRERGWLEKTAIHVADEPAVHNMPSWREKADYVRSLAPEIRIIDAIEAPDFGTSLDIWVPKLNHYHNWQASYERARENGAELWFYTCCHPMGRYANRYIDYPLIKTRILHWMNWRFNLTGYLHWGLIAWSEDPFASPVRASLPPGDAWIVYPGPDGPIDSIRWEALRDGIEDYEYLWLLTNTAASVKEKLGEAAEGFEPSQLADDLCHEAVPDMLGYTRSAGDLGGIRRRIAGEIVALQSRPSLLVWTDPPARDAIAGPPAVAVVYIACEPGATVSLNGKEVELDEKGFHAQNLFLSPGEQKIEVSATLDAQTVSVTRRLTVTQ